MKRSLLFIAVLFSSCLYAQQANTATKTLTYKSQSERSVIVVTFYPDRTCEAVLKTGLPAKQKESNTKPNYGNQYYYGSPVSGKQPEYVSATGFAYAYERSTHKKYEVKFQNCNEQNFLELICEAVYNMPKKDREPVASGIAAGPSAYDGLIQGLELESAKCSISNFVDKIVKNI
ncbi:MAG: hypothetical protein WCQ47_08955 [bacterium]